MKWKIMYIACALITIVVLYYWTEDTPKNHGIFPWFRQDNCNFFLVETSGSSTLKPRQLCAIESVAFHHNYSNVTVFMFPSNLTGNSAGPLQSLNNVNIIYTSFKTVFDGTLLERWYQEGAWKESQYRVSHLSDALRYLLVWMYGGVYLDLDVVVLKPLCGMRDFTILESQDTLASCVFGFRSKHPLLSRCLQSFRNSYKASCFICVGPGLITNSFKLHCGVKALVEKRKCDVRIYPSITAFPAPYGEWTAYFEKAHATNLLLRARDSSLIHVWNKLSENKVLSLNSGSAYEEIMKHHCPTVYRYLVSNSLSI